ncbi:unnamed protein product [Schistosoma mattheei]|uniref:Uncharacterized protein n=1 Tax=Schistosoma mattheei TaxID=31246 RepID=A0A3P8CPE4_9TREM|nr:unnamed protein product [Schistosoma mattheei]
MGLPSPDFSGGMTVSPSSKFASSLRLDSVKFLSTNMMSISVGSVES